MGRIMQLPETSWAEFKRLFSAFISAALSNTVTFDGVAVGDLSAVNHYGECATAAASAEKTVACAGFTLVTGAKIAVKFKTTNTSNNPSLNVNSTGAKPIYYRGSAIPAEYLAANRTYAFIYNGVQYELVGDVTPDVTAIANGGTGAATVANARKNLFASNLGNTAQYLIGITNSWADGGYVSIADAKSLLDVKTIQQGTVTIYNKFVISGCVVSAVANSRNIILTETGTSSAKGASKFYSDGAIHSLTDGLTAAVPKNSTSAAVTYYACLVKNSSGNYELKVQTSTDAVLPLYKIVVPANHTAANLTSVTITNVRRIESSYTNFYASRPYASVALPTALSNTNYSVDLRAESWSGNVGELVAYDLANNGFKIAATGDADNILVRWCATAQ